VEKAMSAIRVWVVAACAFLVTTPAFADEYTAWAKDEKRQTYVCEYKYDPKDPTLTEKRKQTIVIYYGDEDRAGWAYYYNAANKPWARVAIAGNPKYSSKAMYWETLKADGTGYEPFKDKDGEPFGQGYCPTAKDGKKPILNLPLPPDGKKGIGDLTLPPK
jgi:hypothetical protein